MIFESLIALYSQADHPLLDARVSQALQTNPVAQ